jgi:hypothetical protein
MSFRSTTSAKVFTNRGFKIVVDRGSSKVRFIFDPAHVNTAKHDIRDWLSSVRDRVGLEPITPEPYWGFDDLKYAIGAKIMNCFYVVADTKIDKGHEFFKYERLLILSGFSFDRFLEAMENGLVLIDFDARTGHNHGTKFRVKQEHWADLYSSVLEAI